MRTPLPTTSRRHVAALAVLALLAAPAAARAAQGSASMTVTATVPDACIIQTATLAFGNYAPLTTHATTPLDASVALTVGCTGGSGTGIGLDNGLSFSGSRRLKDGTGTAFLNYELYKDAGRASRWGDTTTAGGVNAAGFPFLTTGFVSIWVYGRVFAGQLPPVGTFTDTVTATVYF